MFTQYSRQSCKGAAHLPQVQAGVQLPDAKGAASKQHRQACLCCAARHCTAADSGVANVANEHLQK